MENQRVEIDTSAPFESVREAASRFGGVGYLRRSPFQNEEEFDAAEEAAILESVLIVKERETLDVLKELDSTKMLIEDLKSDLHAQVLGCTGDEGSVDSDSQSSCDAIMEELKQAKLNLSRRSDELVTIRASIDSLNKKLEEETASLAKTRDRVAFNSSTISSLEDELKLTNLKLLEVQQARVEPSGDGGIDVTRDLQRLISEAEQFNKISGAAKLESMEAISEIERTRIRIKTAEERMIASICVAESVAAICVLDEAIASKSEVLKSVDEAMEEVKSSKNVLEEALNRVEVANKEKLVVEEALRKWRSDNGQRRRSLSNSTKFKNSCHHKYSNFHDENLTDESAAPLKSTLSIGQILSTKLLLPEEIAAMELATEKTSLSKLLSRGSDQRDDKENNSKQLLSKKKKFGFSISHLLVKQNKKTKQPTPDLR